MLEESLDYNLDFSLDRHYKFSYGLNLVQIVFAIFVEASNSCLEGHMLFFSLRFFLLLQKCVLCTPP